MIEALVLLGTACLGLLLVSIAAPASLRWDTASSVLWPLALAAGLGLTSCVYFLVLAAGLSQALLVSVEAVLVVVLLAWKWKRQPLADRENKKRRPQAWIVSLFAVGLTTASAACIALVFRNPHGSWDAVAIWNDRAHFLYRARVEGLSPLATQSVWTHPDYPLLLPGSIARLWEWAGQESMTAPSALSLAAVVALISLLVGALRHLRNTNWALLAGYIALSTPFLIVSATHQMADMLVALYILASFVLYCLSRSRFSEQRSLLALSGMMAGFCAWTKNEGILFALSFLVSLLILGQRSRTNRQAEWVAFSAGCIPVLAVVMLFKGLIEAPNDILGSFDWERTMSSFISPRRYFAIIRQGMLTLFLLDGWPNPFFALAAYIPVAGLERRSAWRSTAATIGLAIGLVVAGYFVVYLITPNSLSWQLHRSAARLFLHLWPTMLFLAFLVMRPPQTKWNLFSGRFPKVDRIALAE